MISPTDAVFMEDLQKPWHITSYRKYYLNTDYAICGVKKVGSTRKLAKDVAMICPKCLELRNKE